MRQATAPGKRVAMSGPDLDTPYRGGFVGQEHHFALTVYFEDTDTAGVVYYANYLKFMERARSDMIRAVGVDQGAALRSDGSAYFVTEVAIRYRRPARLGDDLVVVSNVETVRAASVDIHQRVMRGHGIIGRREGDRRLPGPRRPAAAPAQGLGRAVQFNHVREVMRLSSSKLMFAALAACAGSAAHAQTGSSQIVIAVPQFPTPKNVKTDGGETGVIGMQISQQIVADLRTTPGDLSDWTRRSAALHAHRGGRAALSHWANIGAGALVTGYVQARDDGRIHGRLLPLRPEARARDGPQGLRRRSRPSGGAPLTAAPAPSSPPSPSAPAISTAASPMSPRPASRTSPVKRIAIMNWDGTDHSYLTPGRSDGDQPAPVP